MLIPEFPVALRKSLILNMFLVQALVLSCAALLWTGSTSTRQDSYQKRPYMFQLFITNLATKNILAVPLQKAVYKDDFTICCTMHETFNRLKKKKDRSV